MLSSNPKNSFSSVVVLFINISILNLFSTVGLLLFYNLFSIVILSPIQNSVST